MSASKEFKARLLIQQCVSASLKIQDDLHCSEIQIKRGIVVYVCFLKDCSLEVVERMVKTVMKVKLSESSATQSLVSVVDVEGEILVVPQATLGGKLKGSSLQYHGNVDKEEGLKLYENFVQCCGDAIGDPKKVTCGKYGQRQMLNIETNGPFSHILDF